MKSVSGQRTYSGQRWSASILAMLLAITLIWGSAGCSRSENGAATQSGFKPTRTRLAEVSPPFTIQTLKQSFEANQPQIEILSPKPGQVLDSAQVEVKLSVKDFDLYKDKDLGLGPYIQLLLDAQPYAQLYDVSQPLTLELTPGTHTIRAFATQPWHESFKNDGAFAQSTFHIFTKTPENNPDPNQPLLTYNYPQGTYGAEPVLLDFFLTNAPLHLVARQDSQDAIPDWQIRCTINGESFTFDRWEPIYLKGLRPGTNWVQLELIDDKGQPLPNAFNNAVQLVTYEPGGSDTLAQLTRGELTADAARKIVDPNYLPPAVPEPAEPAEPESSKSDEVSEPEADLEPDSPDLPDLTEELMPEAIPPEVIAPAQTEPLQDLTTGAGGSASPELAAPEVESEPEFDPEAIKAEFEVMQDKLDLLLPPEPAALPPIAPLPETAETALDTAPISLPKISLPQLAPKPVSQPTLKPAQPQAIDQSLPELPLSKLLPESLLPDLHPEAQPRSGLFPGLNRESAASAKSDLIGALERVKAFFEGLRKQPTEEGPPLFSPLLRPETSLTPVPALPAADLAPEDATIIDTLMDALPDSLRQPLMQELPEPTASSANPD